MARKKKTPIAELVAASNTLNESFTGKTYRHLETGDEYIITGFVFNVSTNVFDATYCPVTETNLDFSRPWLEFNDGRFQKVPA